MNHSFVLKFQLPPEGPGGDALTDALAHAGCDDALVGVGVAGRVALEFDREAGSAWEALTSAIDAVRSAIPGARLIEVGPDIVGLTDLAEALGVSRQYARRLLLDEGSRPPLAIHCGKTSLWHLHAVLEWLQAQGRPVPGPLVDVARSARRLNAARDVAGIPGIALDPELRAAVDG